MARSLNKTVLIGHLGADPDVRQAKNGSSIANFSLATGESWRDKETGKINEITEWHRVVVFGKAADAVSQFLRKGHRVYIEGKNRTREWTDEAGVRRWTTEVVVDLSGDVIFLEARKEDGESAADKRAESQYDAYAASRNSEAAHVPSSPPAENDSTSTATHPVDGAAGNVSQQQTHEESDDYPQF